MRKRYIQDPETGKLVPASEYRRRGKSHQVMEDIEPFVSPVDGSIISSRKDLREHNRRNNVVQYEEDTGAIKARQREQEALFSGKGHDSKRRKDALKFAVDVNSRPYTKAERRQMAENYSKRSKHG